jgi:hypothetical protein
MNWNVSTLDSVKFYQSKEPPRKNVFLLGENHGKILGNYEESIMNGGLLGKKHRENGFPACNV